MAEGSLFSFWHTKITDFLLLSCNLPYPEFNTNLFIDLHCVHIRKKLPDYCIYSNDKYSILNTQFRHPIIYIQFVVLP